MEISTFKSKLRSVIIRFKTSWPWTCGTLAGVAVAAFILGMNGEPSYERRPLSFWLDQFTSSRNATERSQAQLAISRIGTNGLPVLLAMLGKRDSKARQALQTFIERRSAAHIRSAAEYHLMARNGFCVLGRKASAAEPQLARLSHDQDPDISTMAGAALLDVKGGLPGSSF